MKFLVYFLMVGSLFGAPNVWAYEAGDIFVDPRVAIGTNVAQGTFYMIGLDAGFAVTQQLALGAGGYYSFGQHPSDDREIGAGPFVIYFQPIATFLVAHIREDIDYIDQHNPVQTTTTTGKTVYTHTNESGFASITSLGLHFKFTSAFGIMLGYRAVLSLANSDLGRDRSGAFLGITIGI